MRPMAVQNRAFSAAAFSVKSKFEAAYKAKMEAQSKVTKKVQEPENQVEYG